MSSEIMRGQTIQFQKDFKVCEFFLKILFLYFLYSCPLYNISGLATMYNGRKVSIKKHNYKVNERDQNNILLSLGDRCLSSVYAKNTKISSFFTTQLNTC